MKKKKLEYYDFYDLVDKVDEKIGYDQRDAGKHFHPNSGDFRDWCKFKNYSGKDPKGKDIDSSKLWYSEFKKDVSEKKWEETPYMDFWHWQLDNCFSDDVRNDSYNYFYVGLDELDDDDIENWQLEIQKVYYELFYDISNNGWIPVRICW